MSVDLIISLYTDKDGQDRFRVDHPISEEETVEVTDQFELTTVEREDGAIGFVVFKKAEVEA